MPPIKMNATDPYYQIETILDHRVRSDGEYEYFVKWQVCGFTLHFAITLNLGFVRLYGAHTYHKNDKCALFLVQPNRVTNPIKIHGNQRRILHHKKCWTIIMAA